MLLRQNGVDLAVIGMLKVLWAPWVDRIASERLGHHRGRILPLQATVILCVASLAALALLRFGIPPRTSGWRHVDRDVASAGR